MLGRSSSSLGLALFMGSDYTRDSVVSFTLKQPLGNLKAPAFSVGVTTPLQFLWKQILFSVASVTKKLKIKEKIKEIACIL